MLAYITVILIVTNMTEYLSPFVDVFPLFIDYLFI
jgi:hypothetical protein